MTVTPGIEFSVSDPSRKVSSDSEEWNTCLPATGNPTEDQGRLPARVGDYFKAAESFLRDKDFEVIRGAAAGFFSAPVEADEIQAINVCLVKHGRFYHPSKVFVRLKHGRSFPLALNIAFSPEGNDCVDRECRTLSVLAEKADAIPRVFGKKSNAVQGGFVFSAFAVQWFENYHEFHLSLDNQGDQRIIVWDTEKGHYYLKEDAAFTVYRQVARIMTGSYNFFTCEQIQPWHHAAGDFIIKNDETGVDVRLITVRQYTSLFREIPEELDDLAEAAVIFLIGLSIRTRLDRADGVGDTLWACNDAVAATVQGFFDELALSLRNTPGGRDLENSIKETLGRLDPDDILDYSRMIIASYNPLSPDVVVIEKNVESHARELHLALTGQCFCPGHNIS